MVVDGGPDTIGAEKDDIAIDQCARARQRDIRHFVAAQAVVDLVQVGMVGHVFEPELAFAVEHLHDGVIFGAENQLAVSEMIKTRIPDVCCIELVVLYNSGHNGRAR